MSVVVSIRVKKNIIELVDEMIRYGIASSRNEAFNLLIQKGIEAMKKEIERRKRVRELISVFEKQGGIVLSKQTDVSKEISELRD